MKKYFLTSLFVLSLMFLFAPSNLLAKIGVGVGTGKIQVDDQLKPGTIYNLPSITVFNTGDELSEYGLRVAYHEQQPELKPDAGWFSFNPSRFELEPGTAKEIEISLNLPLRVEPGEYFAYLEGYPYAKSSDGNTTVGIAAASKLYFTVIPGNVFEGFYYRALSIWKLYSPWSERILVGLIVIISLLILKRFLNFEVSFKKNKKDE